MTERDLKPASFEPADGLKQFNEFQSQSRARMEATLKLVLVVSGGMLTLSVGAVLGNTPPNIPSHLLPALAWAWSLLFYSIATSLLLMFSMIIATFHMGVLMRKKLEEPQGGFAFVATWPWLRVLNGILGVSVLVSCVAGIAVMAYVALGVANTIGVIRAPASTAIISPTTTSNPALKRDCAKARSPLASR